MSSTTAGFNLQGYNLAGNKSIVLVAHSVAVTPVGNFTLTYAGTSEPAQWQSQWNGTLLSLNATVSGTLSSGNSVKVYVANNGNLTALSTAAVNLTGTRQITNIVPSNTITFAPGDVLSLVGVPSAALSVAITVTATLMVII